VVFARQGYGGTRLEDIAAEAGVSRTSMYHYFSSRRAIFLELGRVAILGYRRVIEAARATPTDWTGDDLAGLIAAQLEYLDRHGSVIPIWTQATWSDPDLRDVGLAPQLHDFAAIGTELARLRGSADVDPIHEGIVFTGMIERLWFFARNGGAGAIGDDEMRRTLLVEVSALLAPRPASRLPTAPS
jgi:AcrR family transcriptional regulator